MPDPNLRHTVVHGTPPEFECIGGPLDGEFRPAPLSSTPFKGGVYVLRQGTQGAADYWQWVPLSEGAL